MFLFSSMPLQAGPAPISTLLPFVCPHPFGSEHSLPLPHCISLKEVTSWPPFPHQIVLVPSRVLVGKERGEEPVKSFDSWGAKLGSLLLTEEKDCVILVIKMESRRSDSKGQAK